MVFMMIGGKDSSIRSLVDSLASKYTQILIGVYWIYHDSLLQCRLGEPQGLFVLLILKFQHEFLRWQRSIDELFFPYCFIENCFGFTFVSWFHQRRKTNFSSLIPCFIENCFCFWLSSAAMLGFSPVLHILSPLLPLRLNFLMLEASEWTCGTRLQWVTEFITFAVLDEVCLHQQYKRILSCVSEYRGGFLHCSFIGILQGIAAGIGTSNFLRGAFIVSLNSTSFGSIKNIPLNYLALSNFGFSIVRLFFFDASDTCFHISGHTVSVREVVCFLVSKKSLTGPSATSIVAALEK